MKWSGRICFRTQSNREEVLTDAIAAQINDAGENTKGPGHAIGNDDVRSSNWLRIKDFQQCDLPSRNLFDWLRHGGFAGVGSRYRSRQFAPATTQTR